MYALERAPATLPGTEGRWVHTIAKRCTHVFAAGGEKRAPTTPVRVNARSAEGSQPSARFLRKQSQLIRALVHCTGHSGLGPLSGTGLGPTPKAGSSLLMLDRGNGRRPTCSGDLLMNDLLFIGLRLAGT